VTPAVTRKYFSVTLHSNFAGKTAKSHPKVDCPSGWIISHSHNHWSTMETMKEWLNKIAIPWKNAQISSLDLTHTQKVRFCDWGNTRKTLPQIMVTLSKVTALMVTRYCLKVSPLFAVTPIQSVVHDLTYLEFIDI
jgi:hypothetical protein